MRLIPVIIAVLLLCLYCLACGLGLVRYRRRNARSRSLATAGLTAPLGSASVLPPSDSSMDASQPSELGSESSAPSDPRRVEGEVEERMEWAGLSLSLHTQRVTFVSSMDSDSIIDASQSGGLRT